mgnify:CR=1 FL=1
MPANPSTSFPYRCRTDDVMKLLMIGFEGLFHFCNPSAVMGWHAIGGQSWSRFLNLTDEYPDQTSAAIIYNLFYSIGCYVQNLCFIILALQR